MPRGCAGRLSDPSAWIILLTRRRGPKAPRLWREGRRAQPREKGANMKKLAKALARYAVDLAMVAGATAVAVGAGMIYLPAGLIAGGVLAIAGAVLANLGGGDEG